MTSQEIFNLFCKYIDDRIFSNENIGSYVAFVVDSAVIQEFCKQTTCSEQTLMNAVHSHLYYCSHNISTIKGILAIQLYAASKRANSDGVTVNNYRDRLSQVLNWDINDLQTWMKDNQENYWDQLYKWCDTNYFQITKCERKTGTGRYVQYPVNQALRVFTEEDLQYIASSFVDNKLQPGEDISEKDFWQLLSKRRIISYVTTHHGHEVLDNSISELDYQTQIFNYFLRWNGEYKRKGTSETKDINDESNHLYLYINDALDKVDIRKNNLSLVQSIRIDSLTTESIKRYYTFKREGIILFKRDDIYENMWQETRFLERGTHGIAVCFKNKGRHLVLCSRKHLLFENKNILICRIAESINTLQLFTQKRFYKLEGGLKLGRNIYLLNACPILKLEKSVTFWLDGKKYNGSKLIHSFNYLEPGLHNIKFQHFKRLEFEVVSQGLSKHTWKNEFNKWQFNKKDILWKSGKYETGAIGLNFTYIPNTECESNKPILQRWAMFLLKGSYNENEKNIGVNLIKNI